MSITIGTIRTKPERDPMGGITRTVLHLDPQRQLVTVTQEWGCMGCREENMRDLVKSWEIPGWPHSGGMRQWILDQLPLLQTICDGFSHRITNGEVTGRYTPEAQMAYADLDFTLDIGCGPASWHAPHPITAAEELPV